MFNKYLEHIQPSASMKMGLTEQDKPVTNLAIGVPDLQTDAEVVDILARGAKEYHLAYVPSRGSKKALHSLKQLAFDSEEHINQDNLMLVSGAKYGIYLALKTICNAGDTVVLMQPYWLSYPEIVHALGLNLQSWCPAVDGLGNLDFSIEALGQIMQQYRPKALILNNPNNPAGKVFAKEWLLGLNVLLKKYDCWLIIDEVYRELVFDVARATDFPITDTNIVRVGSLSKSLSVPGLRLGYICGPKNMIDHADLFNQHIQTCINSLSCYLIENLDAGMFHAFARKCAAAYEERFATVQQVLHGSKLRLLHSEASFYTLVDFGQFFSEGQQACDHLAAKLNIITVQGLPYGSNFSTYIRICLTLPAQVLGDKCRDILKSLV